MQPKKSPFALIFTILVAGLALFGIFREDFSQVEELPQSFAAYRPLPDYDRCTFTVEVSGEAWLACVSTSRPKEPLPIGLPTNYPTYEGVTPVPITIAPQVLKLPRKMSDAEILERVQNPYKEYCTISSWRSYKIKPLKRPFCPQDTEETTADPKNQSNE